MIQISDQFMGELLGRAEHIVFFIKAVLDAALREKQLLVGKPASAEIQRLKMIPRVPVETQAGNHGIRCFVDDVAHPFISPLFVVVPDIQLQIGKIVSGQQGEKMISEEALFLVCRKNAAVPGLHGFCLVLKTHARHREAEVAHVAGIAAEIVGVRPVTGRLQFPAAFPAPVRFHEGRRRPGGEHDRNPAAGQVLRVPQHGQDVFLHARKVRRARGGVAVVLVDAEITAVDVNADKLVVHPVGGKIRRQELALLRSAHLRIGRGCGLGQSAAEALKGLVAQLRVKVNNPVFRFSGMKCQRFHMGWVLLFPFFCRDPARARRFTRRSQTRG